MDHALTRRYRNALFDTWPVVIHGHGRHRFKPEWDRVRDHFFASSPARVESGGVAVLTCNNGHEAMGMLERSCAMLGVEVTVAGQGVHPWVNSRDKPRTILAALEEVSSPYVLYADSRDAILVGSPTQALSVYRAEFPGCGLLFGADRINWPNVASFKSYEESLPGADNEGGFRYLNGGAWIGETEFCREFFRAVLDTEPVPDAADSEQGLLKKLLPSYYPRVQLDYRCTVLQNLGFVLTPLMELPPCEGSSSTASSATASATSPAPA